MNPSRPHPKLARGGRGDSVWAVLVLLAVGLLVVPIPAPLLDVLIAANLTLAPLLLLLALRIKEPLELSSFPTAILITTLFRLALNLSSSRLILLHAQAGQVIHAFGHWVVQGSTLVGGVIFLMLSIVQYLVIAKGGERVAEVGARFALDALPGRQTAIEAELKIGHIDGKEAQRQRRVLARESQFYGAMDGALRFVKGDVIATFLIAWVNLAVGLCIGVVQRGWDIGRALKVYGLLSIGDALVTQIPSIIVATAAGIVVTRVASKDHRTSMGQELSAQLVGSPQPLLGVTGFLLLLAAMPGLPALPFLSMAGVTLVAAVGITPRAKRPGLRWLRRAWSRSATPRGLSSSPQPDSSVRHPLPQVAPWSLALASNLAPLLGSPRGPTSDPEALFPALVGEVEEKLFTELGVRVPPCELRVSKAVPSGQLQLNLRDIPLALLPLSESPGEASLTRLSAQLFRLLRREAAQFLGIQETHQLIEAMETQAPALVKAVIPEPISLPLLTEILRSLLDEGVSIRDLHTILEALAFAPASKDASSLAEGVRTKLSRAISHQVTGGRQELDVLFLDAGMESSIRSAVSRTPHGPQLSLAPAAIRDIVVAIQKAINNAPEPAASQPMILLTPPDIRRFVRKLVKDELPMLSVLSGAELLPGLRIRSAGRATLGSTE